MAAELYTLSNQSKVSAQRRFRCWAERSFWKNSETPFFDELSIALSEGSSAELQAQQILIFGGISAQHGSQLKMVGNSGIYFLSPSEKLETSISTIQLMGSQMSMDAPDILIDRTIQIGQVIFGQGYPSVLNIGKDPSLTGFTKNVYFTKKWM